MKINITSTADLTSTLEAYIEQKLAPLAKFLKRFEEAGEVELRLEIGRTTRHHRKGDVFKAIADLRLPHQVLRAEEYAEDVRKAIDQARDTLRLEIDKYKTRFVEVKRNKLK